MADTPIRWKCGCKGGPDFCESPAKACQKVQRLEDEVAGLRAVVAVVEERDEGRVCGVDHWRAVAEDEHGRVLALEAGLLALVADEWVGWGLSSWEDEWDCFYCHARGPVDGLTPPAHHADCPVAVARAALAAEAAG